jgi:hypothetical protein
VLALQQQAALKPQMALTLSTHSQEMVLLTLQPLQVMALLIMLLSLAAAVVVVVLTITPLAAAVVDK